MNSVRKQYDGIDLLKFIACFFVVAIHTDPLYDINKTAYLLVVNGIARVAIPLFFITSAFFLFRRELTAENIKRYLLRMAKLYLCWFLVLLPVTVFNRFICGDGSFAQKIFHFICSSVFSASFSGSWFLTSCMFCAVLFLGLEKLPRKTGRTVTVILSAFFYLVSVATSSYGNILNWLGLGNICRAFEKVFCQPYLNLFAGIPYFAVGKYLAENETKKTNYLLLAISFLLLIAEVLLVDRFDLAYQVNHYLMLLPCAFYLFLWGKDLNLRNPASRFMRAASTIVYLSQFLWIFAVELAEYVFRISIVQTGKYLIVCLLGILTAVLLFQGSKCKHFHWLKAFY